MIVFKPIVVPSDICRIDPHVRILLSYFESYCIQFGINEGVVTVSSAMSDEVQGRISSTHAEGRAVDISIKGFTEFHSEKIASLLNKKFSKEWGTRPKGSDFESRVCVIHDSGNGNHFHLQVRKDIPFDVDLYIC